MEKFKETLKKRLWCGLIYNIVILFLLVFGVFDMVTGSNEHITDYISGFNLGVCVGIQFVMLYYLGKYIAALKDESKLKELYISENDERSKFISEKIGGRAVNIIVLGFGLATVVSGYFNVTVFFTLLGALIFSVLVKFILKVYYNKKF